MDLFEAIKGRRSIRNYEDRPVEDDKIGTILEACKWSPSAANRQPWEIIIVDDPELIEKLAKAALEQFWIATAPIVFVVCVNEKIAKAHYGNRGEMYALETIGCAVQNMMLAAHSLGLGSCMVSAFDEDEVKEITECLEFIRPVALLPIGYPAEKPEIPYRDDVPQFTYLNKFGEKKYEPSWDGLDKYKEKMKRKLVKTLKRI